MECPERATRIWENSGSRYRKEMWWSNDQQCYPQWKCESSLKKAVKWQRIVKNHLDQGHGPITCWLETDETRSEGKQYDISIEWVQWVQTMYEVWECPEIAEVEE
jgi:hypothetical protein